MTTGWVRCLAPRPMAAARLICFPWAGGGASAYREWSTQIVDTVEVWGVRMPGHEGRFSEEPVTDLQAAADRIAAELLPMPLPIMLFGHSMGAWLAFEVARRLQAAGAPPRRLIVAGRQAPSRPGAGTPLSALPAGALLREVQARWGGIAHELVDDPEFRDVVLPGLRADLRMLEEYTYEPGRLLDCPLHVLAGARDAHTDAASVTPWGRETTGPFEIIRFGGGHFFIFSERDAVLETLNRLVTAASPRARHNRPSRS